jgi:hypothetical protein
MPRAQRRFHQPNPFNAHPPVAAVFARKGRAKSFEPAVVAAGNHCGVFLAKWLRGWAGSISHAFQPSKPLRNGKASAALNLMEIYKLSALNALNVYGRFTRLRFGRRLNAGRLPLSGLDNEVRHFVR